MNPFPAAHYSAWKKISEPVADFIKCAGSPALSELLNCISFEQSCDDWAAGSKLPASYHWNLVVAIRDIGCTRQQLPNCA
jgi:hypothetical protein